MTQPKLVITHEKPPIFYLLIGLVVVALLLISFYIGRFMGINERESAVEKVESLQQQLAEYQQAYQKANKDLVTHVQHAKVDNLSNKELIETIKSLESTRNQLQAELSFYRNIMAPELSQEGLSISEFDTSDGSAKNKSKFKLVLTQVGKQDQFIKGEVALNLQGTNIQTGLPMSYNFNDLGDFKNDDFKFQFRYFQTIEGEISLPKDFMAEKVSISAKTKGLRKNKTANAEFDWQA